VAETPLHNQRAQLLKLLLLVGGNQRIMVINIPWYLSRRSGKNLPGVDGFARTSNKFGAAASRSLAADVPVKSATRQSGDSVLIRMQPAVLRVLGH
jgi:hypothetical protein